MHDEIKIRPYSAEHPKKRSFVEMVAKYINSTKKKFSLLKRNKAFCIIINFEFAKKKL